MNKNYFLDLFSSIRLHPVQIFNQYRKNQKVKIQWSRVMCSLNDFFDTLWIRITGNGENSIDKLIDLLTIPRLGRKFLVNIIVRIETEGIILVKESSKLRGLENEPFSLKFFYEFKAKDISKNELREKVYNNYIRLALKSITENFKHVKPSDIQICRFDKTITDISIKVVKIK